MSASKKLTSTLANAATGEALNVEDVFSTYLYTGNGSTQTITNGIDLDGEGGMVWFKAREIDTYPPVIFDTSRGVTKYLRTSETSAEQTNSGITAFNSDGFDIAGSFTTGVASPYVSWTFRKAPKFFDVVTYTGSGVSGREIAHSLGTDIGALIIKRTDSTGDWYVWHRSYGSNYSYQYLNETDFARTDSTIFRNIYFDTDSFTLGTSGGVNASGGTYVAYLFAHNDGDGEFGESGDQDIIKCGSYTGTGSAGLEIDLGFEPQWLLVKASTISGGYWSIYDNMRGLPVGSADSRLHPNNSDAENTTFGDLVTLLPNGFSPSSGSNQINQSGDTYIYIAIRRPMKTPESGTEVFDVNETSSNQFVTTGFPVDLQLGQYTGGGTTYVVDRMRGMSTSTTGTQQYLQTQSTGAEAGGSGSIGFNGFVQDGFSHTLGSYPQALWSFKRSPGFFDVVCYEGDDVAGRTVNHNLGVVPELMIVKKRSGTGGWGVYHKDLGASAYCVLQVTNAAITNNSFPWNDTVPTEEVFTLGTGFTNDPSSTYIAYLFATLPGISKVGSYTGTGATQTIDCGFSTGARFVLAKRVSGAGQWYMFDSERGITATDQDGILWLNLTDQERTESFALGYDQIQPDSSGFKLTLGGELNESGETFIFLAIA
jgi:hypothetical protein